MNILTSLQRELLQRFAANRLSDIEKEQVIALLRRFTRGEMNEADSEEVISILAENDRCLAFLDTLWLQQPSGVALAGVPALDMSTSLRIQNDLSRKIQHGEMMSTVLKMGTKGFFNVALGFIRPFAYANKKLLPRRKRKAQ